LPRHATASSATHTTSVRARIRLMVPPNVDGVAAS
jgi:hypothetical protein